MVILTNSCTKAKDTSGIPKETLAVGKWNINRMQLRIYYAGTFSRDTIIPQTPLPENYVQFDASGGFQYKFNTANADMGTYQFVGVDSLIAISATKTYNWKWLTITDVLFTCMTTGTSPAFPGATVETYYTLVK